MSTGVIDIGRKSVWDLAVATLGTDRIHCMGTVDVDKDRLNSSANCLLDQSAVGEVSQSQSVQAYTVRTTYVQLIYWCVLLTIKTVRHSVTVYDLFQSPIHHTVHMCI